MNGVTGVTGSSPISLKDDNIVIEGKDGKKGNNPVHRVQPKQFPNKRRRRTRRKRVSGFQTKRKDEYSQIEKYLTQDQVTTLLSLPLEKKKSLLIKIGLEAGMRVSEVAGILLRNINGNYIKIYDYKKNDWRMVVISDELAAELDEYVVGITSGKRKPKRLFNVCERTINNWLKKIFLRAELPPNLAHWHTFRHTFVRRCQHLGLDPSFAVAQTGDSPETILKYYGKPSLDDRLKTLRETPLYAKRRI